MGAAGGTAYIYLNFVNPFAHSHAAMKTSNPLTKLTVAHGGKKQIHQGFFAEVPVKSRLGPVPISTLVG